MATVKRLICLANSRKLSGRCVAGKELAQDGSAVWVRPVSAREHEEVSEYERRYPDGRDPRLLDVMDVPLLDARPKAYQQENWLLDPKGYWRPVRRAEWQEVATLVDPVEALWIDGHSTYNGRNDKIPLELTEPLRSSLRLIRVDRLRIAVSKPGEKFDDPKRRVQGRFQFNGTQYHLRVTHPRYERRFLAQPDGTHDLGECLLTISLGEPFKGATYKLIAAIIEPTDQGQG